jgi:hypothetical protein
MNDQIGVLDNAYKTAENETLGYDAENVEYVQSATIPGSNMHDVPAQIPFWDNETTNRMIFFRSERVFSDALGSFIF